MDVFGELSTLDPCSLVNLEEFRPFGTPVRWELLSFDECRVQLTDDRGELVVHFGLLAPPDAGIRPTSAYPEGAAYGCYNGVPLAGGGGLGVTEWRLEESAAESMEADDTVCEASDALTLSIRTTLPLAELFDIDFRHLEPRIGSLGGVAACGLLRSSEVEHFAGAPHVTAFPAGHRCWWNGVPWAEDFEIQNPYPWVRLVLTAGSESAYDDGRSERIAGRDSSVLAEELEYFSKCTVATDHGPFVEGADGAREYAVLTVEFDSGDAEACRVARRLAELAWPRLPAR